MSIENLNPDAFLPFQISDQAFIKLTHKNPVYGNALHNAAIKTIKLLEEHGLMTKIYNPDIMPSCELIFEVVSKKGSLPSQEKIQKMIPASLFKRIEPSLFTREGKAWENRVFIRMTDVGRGISFG